METSNLSIAAIRALGIDAINKANSGHPGMVLGSAPAVYTLFTKEMNFYHKQAKQFNRDRFVLSSGHGSALLYATMFLCGYPITLEDLKQFRVYGGKSVSSATKFSGIEFGSGKSSKRCYIYDKTRELTEVKDKPWIRQYWQENGLISDEKTHVYRAEISIKCDGMDLLNMSTGELFKLSPEYLKSQPAIEKLFHFYAARMFRFHRKGKHTRVRDYDRIELFENSPIITCKPKKVCVNADTGRTEKICVSTLSKLSCQYSDLAQEYSSALSRCITFLSEVAGIKYAKEKLAKEIQGLEAFKGIQFKEQGYIEYFALVEALGKIRYSYAYQNPDKDNLEDITCSLADDSLEMYYQYLEWSVSQDENFSPF